MRRHHRNPNKKAGLPPGTLVSSSGPAAPAKIHIIGFNPADFWEKDIASLEDLPAVSQDNTVTWIDIVGASKIEVLEQLGHLFAIHSLVLEDILNTVHRPKIENYEDYLFLITKNIRLQADDLAIEQTSLIIGKNYVISFSENDGNVFDAIRSQLRSSKSKLRRGGADYLGYALLDIIVDNYFLALEHVGDDLEQLEERVMRGADPAQVRDIQGLRTDLLFIRKAIWPLREILGTVERGSSDLIQPTTHLYIRDVYDHVIQLIDAVETYREIVNGLMDIYLSSISNRMNEIMKVLTIISTIFIPLTFLAGLEGMNFKVMPELEWQYGYPALLLFMALIVFGMIRFFKNKNWL